MMKQRKVYIQIDGSVFQIPAKAYNPKIHSKISLKSYRAIRKSIALRYRGGVMVGGSKQQYIAEAA